MSTPAEQLVDRVISFVKPPEHVTVSAWSRRGRYLSRESSAAPGRFVPKSFQVEPLDAFSDESVKEAVICSAVQMLKTECILSDLGYVIAVDPGPCLVVEPRDLDCETFSRERLAPMLRDSPELKEKTQDSNSASILHKPFFGGFIDIVAAGSAPNLKARPVRYLFCDEVDSYPATAGREGSPIALARKRLSTYHNAKVVLVGSPTVQNESAIWDAYQCSDQRRYHVPCGQCGHLQVLSWEHVQFNKSGSDEERANSAVYVCESCGAKWNDTARHRSIEGGRWVASRPFNGVAGFWISELYSPWKSLSSITLDFLTKRRQGPHALQTFINCSLAECWADQGERPAWEDIYSRREDYPIGEVPRGGLLLTAGIDVQTSGRLECEVVAWGRNRESWSVDYQVLMGNISDKGPNGPWAALTKLLTQRWPVEGGGGMSILAAAVDSGAGSQIVYDSCRRFAQPVPSPAGIRCPRYPTVFPIKGTSSTEKLISAVSDIDHARRERQGLIVYSVGSSFGKEDLYATLKLPVGAMGCAHFPQYDAGYFRSLTSEIRVTRADGRVDWVKTQNRNESLDTRIYAMAAAEICGISRFRPDQWAELERRLVTNVPAGTPTSPAPGAAGGPPSTVPSDSTARAEFYNRFPHLRPGGRRPIRGSFL